MSENLNQWFGIPSGGELHLAVTGKTPSDSNFVVAVRLLPTAGPEVIWADHEVNPGPKTLVFSEDISYAVRIAIKFLGPTNEHAVIIAQVFNAAGNPIRDWWDEIKYEYEVVGKVGELPKRATLFLIED